MNLYKTCLLSMGLIACNSYSMDTLKDLMHYSNKWYNDEYQRKHVCDQESKDLCQKLTRIALEGTGDRALDKQTATDLRRFNERCYILGEQVIKKLEENNVATVKDLYQNAPREELNVILQLFMLRSLIQAQNALDEEKNRITSLIQNDGTHPLPITQKEVHDKFAMKKAILGQLSNERQQEAQSLLHTFMGSAIQVPSTTGSLRASSTTSNNSPLNTSSDSTTSSKSFDAELHSQGNLAEIAADLLPTPAPSASQAAIQDTPTTTPLSSSSNTTPDSKNTETEKKSENKKKKK